MILGLNFSHDASASLISEDGQVIHAISEERFSRIKNHIGIPIRSINSLLSLDDTYPISEIVVGTFENPKQTDVQRLIVNLDDNPSNPEGKWQSPHPGYSKNFNRTYSEFRPTDLVEGVLSKILGKFNIDLPRVTWMNHHEAHLGCALGVANQSKTLLISLDGEGDGDSGAVALSNFGKYQLMARFSRLDSLGNLYSAVTERYNFKAGKHEGKITGLAAFGHYSAACDLLLDYVKVDQGYPKIDYVRNFKQKLTQKSKSVLGIKSFPARSLDEIVALAESRTENYADLAFAIQHILEKCVLEIIDYWTSRTGVENIALSGGVFANVKLNQRIAELSYVKSVRIYPNMGDGGLSVGGVWAKLASESRLNTNNLVSNMYLATATSFEDSLALSGLKSNPNFCIEEIPEEELVNRCARDIDTGLIVALHKGSMEFGPRALGNRSLLADPRNANVVKDLNSRLSRTEFMPFAPMVLAEFAHDYFQLPPDLQPFEYMTMTCDVKSEYRNALPAVTHIDGTARPQIVSKGTNEFVWKILNSFKEITGFPVLVNTSLNIHEEPINFSLIDTVRAFERNAFDVLYTSELRITKR